MEKQKPEVKPEAKKSEYVPRLLTNEELHQVSEEIEKVQKEIEKLEASIRNLIIDRSHSRAVYASWAEIGKRTYTRKTDEAKVKSVVTK
jgi:hypothetical protein